MAKKPPRDDEEQSRRFEEAASELDPVGEENGARAFERTMGKVLSHHPDRQKPRGDLP